MFVKPAEGRMVRRPDTLVHLLAAGEHVPDGDEFWIRRLRDGDVETAEAPPPDDSVSDEKRPADGFFVIGKHLDPHAVSEEEPA